MIQHKGFTTDGAQIDMRHVRANLGNGIAEMSSGMRVSTVIEGIEQTVNEMMQAHNEMLVVIEQVIGGQVDNFAVDQAIIDARPVEQNTPQLSMRLDMLHTKMARLLQAQIELRAAVRL